MLAEVATIEPTTTVAPDTTADANTTATVELPDPDLDDPGSEAYGQAMGDDPPTETAPEAEVATAEQIAEPEQTLWRRDGSKFVKYEAPKPVAPKIEPWKANIYGKEVEALPGVVRNEAGALYIPPERVGDLNRMLAHATKYPEVQKARQDRAADRETYTKRETFQAEAFEKILTETLLNPNWMEWAVKDQHTYETAQMNVKERLRAAALDLRDKYGALPTTTAGTDAGAETLDLYEGEAAVDGFLSEELTSPDYHGMTADDTKAIKQMLRDRDVPIFHLHPEQGWVMDERPIRALLDARKASRNGTSTTARPVVPAKAEQVTRRNEAAIPKSTEPAKPTGAKPKADPFADEPWKNPALNFKQQQALYRKAKGFVMPGSG